jgi:hypothetical protein
VGKINVTKPFKMKVWLDSLKTVLDTRKVLFLTDDDLVMLVNQEIKKSGDLSAMIEPRTFRNWKAGKFHPDEVTGREFMDTLALTYIQMKEIAGELFLTGGKGEWVKGAWLLERKWPEEFALRNKVETTHRQEAVIQISASNEEQKTLIENILNNEATDVSFQEVYPLKIKAKTDNTNDENYDF